MVCIDYLKTPLGQDMYIAPAQNEAETQMIKGIVKQFFQNSVQADTQKLDTEGIETLFSELFMNICQHSFDTNGFIFIPAVTKEGQFEMIASDLGTGIVSNIRNCYLHEAFVDDASVIEYATRDWISSRTKIQNRGRGLNTVLTCVQALKGSLNILSENGQLILENGRVSLMGLSSTHIGNFLHIAFNINQLREKEESDYIDF